MNDCEKVIKGLEWIIQDDKFGFGENWDSGEPQCDEEKAGKIIWDAINLLKEQEERIAIMRESMEAMERRLAAAECQPIEVKSTDQMTYVGWMHEDQKLGLSDSDL